MSLVCFLFTPWHIAQTIFVRVGMSVSEGSHGQNAKSQRTSGDFMCASCIALRLFLKVS